MMKRMRHLALAAAVLSACGAKTAAPPMLPPPAPPEPVPAPPPQPEMSLADVGLDATAMDRTADPCEDFYQYACGGWLARTEIPADKSGTSRFDEMFDRNQKALREVLDKARAAPGDDPTMQKLGAFYGACMDEAAVEAAGTKPLQPTLDLIAKVSGEKSLRAAVNALHRDGAFPLFRVEAEQDYKDATQMILGVGQSGFGLPEKDYYFKDDDKTKAIRAAYRDYLEKLFVLLGRKPKEAAQAAGDVMGVETAMAKVAMPIVERREPEKTYHPMDVAGLTKLAPAVDWPAYLTALGRPDISRFNVESTAYLEGMGKLYKSIPPAQWRSYLASTYIRANAGALPKAYVDLDFSFQQKLTGQQELPPRWKRCVVATDHLLGELLAQPWLKIAFPGESKTSAEKVVGAIVAAMDRNLDTVEWMDDATRARAHEKIKKMIYLVGYPSKWKQYDFPVGTSFYANALAGERWRQSYRLAKVGKPVDRLEFGMTPPTVNASYNPSYNKMTYPAGILQTPFFDARSAWAVNFGGVGMASGHELTHGFDSTGALFDGDGNMSGWWEKAVVDRFKERTACVEKAYGEMEGLPGEKVNGRLTLGENIADIGGVKLALSALHQTRAGEKPIRAEGLSEDQIFFLGFGQAWCSKYREENARVRLATDPHSPPRVRINGSLRQTPAFAEAYQCKPSAKMRAEPVCKVW
jgi:putative endopeptidase